MTYSGVASGNPMMSVLEFTDGVNRSEGDSRDGTAQVGLAKPRTTGHPDQEQEDE